MTIGLIVAMEEELEALAQLTTAIKTHEVHRRTIYEVSFNKNRIFMGISGIGKVNAASFTQILIDKFNVDLIVNTGVAGSLDERLSMLSMLVGSSMQYHDFDPEILRDTFPYETVFKVKESYLDVIQKIAFEKPVVIGPIASGDDFIDSPEKRQRVYSITGAMACDMESAAVAHTAFAAGVDFLVFRAISDTADEEWTGTYATFLQAAADLSAHTFLEVLKNI